MTAKHTNAMGAGNLLLFIISVGACVTWLVVHGWAEDLDLVWRTILPGCAIFGAAFMLSWGAEVAQFDVPQALAIIFVALVAVLPEYAIDMYFAWTAGTDLTYTQYATANMTGANRLLIGVGWAAVLLFFWLKTRRRAIAIGVNNRVEMLALLIATVYSLVIPLKGTLSLLDTIVLLLIFAGYIRQAIKSGIEEPVIGGGIVQFIANVHPWLRRTTALVLFILAGWGVFAAAKPFAEGLLQIGELFHIEKFILVQWVAPLASEAPEFIVAVVFAWRLKPEMGLRTLIASKVNQWTLLVGMLPIAFCLSGGRIHPMFLDARQVQEVFLTAAQSLFALLVIMDLRFSWKAALTIFAMFASQLFFPHTMVRYGYGMVYIVLSIIMLVKSRLLRNGVRQTIRMGWRLNQDRSYSGR